MVMAFSAKSEEAKSDDDVRVDVLRCTDDDGANAYDVHAIDDAARRMALAENNSFIIVVVMIFLC